jgi:KaiC/GvpD/RAD55 family RecA-like ATPase
MMGKPFAYSLIVITLAFGLVSAILLPYVQAQNCQITVTKVDTPTRIDPGKDFQITTHFTITCSSSQIGITPQNSGLIVVRDLKSGENLTRTHFDIIVYLGGNRALSANFTEPSTVTAPSALGTWGIEIDVAVYSSGQVVTSGSTSVQVQVGQSGQLVTIISTSSSIKSTTSTQSSVNTSNTEAPAGSNAISIGTLGSTVVVIAVGAVALIASVVVFTRRKKPSAGVTITKQEAKQDVTREAPTSTSTAVVSKPPQRTTDLSSISTGYPDLDSVLVGGLPLGYAILIVSPPCDEKDLLFRKIIDSGILAGNSIFYVSRDLGRTQDLAGRYPKNFYAFSPQADRVTGSYENFFKIAGVQNLSDLNISLTKAMEPIPKNPKKMIILDILSDVLLEHKALTTRKWLDDFIAKRKTEGFTILGILNALMVSEQESQTIIDLFEGIIEIYEKELRERARRFLIVKKMYGRKYIETELMLDKDKLF